MFRSATTPQPSIAATTVAWSEVRVGDRARPIKIVGLPRRARRSPARPLEVAPPILSNPHPPPRKDA